MKTLSTLKCYQTNLDIWDTDGDHYRINFDCIFGVYTMIEWLEDEVISLFDHDSQKKIIDCLRTNEVII